ncbi:MAG: ribosome silencing factor [Candidatus Alcyoniella australis]|nr:ribosome silencing factor [Candidatus Alcyoniella australis]
MIDKLKELARFASDKNAEEIVVLNVSGLCSFADYIMICHGSSDRQVQAIADNIETEMKHRGDQALGCEGKTQGHWALIDFGEIIVHVFYEPVRRFYDIEGLWPDAERLDLAS